MNQPDFSKTLANTQIIFSANELMSCGLWGTQSGRKSSLHNQFICDDS